MSIFLSSYIIDWKLLLDEPFQKWKILVIMSFRVNQSLNVNNKKKERIFPYFKINFRILLEKLFKIKYCVISSHASRQKIPEVYFAIFLSLSHLTVSNDDLDFHSWFNADWCLKYKKELKFYYFYNITDHLTNDKIIYLNWFFLFN